jgi:dTDP-4-dehydrorhamnose 3,5-epimerase
MKVTDLGIQGIKFLEMNSHADSRGFFIERFKRDEFREAGIPSDEFLQDNFSRSIGGVLRGLHFQHDRPQGKLITALAGRILDVVVDIRHGSPTFGRSLTVEIDGEKPSWLWVPPGFAHGFVALSKGGADIMYKVTAPYNSKGEGGILWNDPALGIDWVVEQPLISDRDAKLMTWSEYQQNPKF